MRKITKKILTVVCVSVLALGLLIGCGEKDESTSSESKVEEVAAEVTTEEKVAEESTGEKKRIGISLVYKGDEWCAAVDEEFKKQAETFGYEVNIQDGNLDNETQLKQIENFITQKYDLIALDPASAEGCIPALEKARAANIPVVIFDSVTTFEDIVSYISWDNYETGVLIGAHIKELVEKDYDGKANVAVLTMASPTTIADRIKGVKDALEGVDITDVAEQDYEGNREKAANIVTNIKEDIDFVVAGQDNGAWGAVSALQALNNTTTKVYSMGAYGAEPFDALEANSSNYQGTVAISPTTLVEETYKTMDAYFDGVTDIPAVTNIDLDLVTTGNIAEYLEKIK